jgi:glucose-1-phosphate cytidylyltransferase
MADDSKLNVVILAGGLGTRLAEFSEAMPKPAVPIGGRPIIWHIMQHYAHHGHREFYLALGYKSEVIKRYFLEYFTLGGNLTVNLGDGTYDRHDREGEDWRVHCIDTGLNTNTGGRVRQLQPFLNDGTFLLTYGDGVSDVNLAELLAFHRRHGRLATVLAVRPPARFGGLVFNGDLVSEFTEKPRIGEGWINGGFMVLEPGVFNYLKDDQDSLEADALEALARDGEQAANRHEGFWQCMDTLRDVRLLEDLWQAGTAPWRLWR